MRGLGFDSPSRLRSRPRGRDKKTRVSKRPSISMLPRHGCRVLNSLAVGSAAVVRVLPDCFVGKLGAEMLVLSVWGKTIILVWVKD